MLPPKTWRLAIGCAGLLTLAGLALRIPLLLQVVNDGEAAIIEALPACIGIVLLAIACLRFLLKRSAGGMLFAWTAMAFILGLALLPTFVLSFWPWIATVIACGGAAAGFARANGDAANS